MMDDLLEILRAGGTHRVTDMAAALDTNSQMVESMVETLGRLGYLRELGTTCGDSCGACPVSGTCTAESSGRVWTLTDKGTAESP